MTDANETVTNNRKAETYDTFNDAFTMQSTEETYDHLDKRDHQPASSKIVLKDYFMLFPRITARLIPSSFEDEHDERDILGNKSGIKTNIITKDDRPRTGGYRRSFRRRLFLFLTEPSSSWLSAVFFFFLIVAISISNLIMIMETMSSFQYRPTECDFCRKDGGFYTVFEEYKTTTSDGSATVVECVCPLHPHPYLKRLSRFIFYFFALEWTLRVLSFVPAYPRSNAIGQWGAWLNYLTSSSTLLDALAIWPYFVERYDLPGLISLRLLRLFRVFQLFRLGSYNSMFVSLTSVLYKSIGFLKLLIVIIFFGATIFGSLLFWLEQGEWKYWEPTGDFQYVRMSMNGKTEEISPFCSIPSAFWWFVVTATTVGYGDFYPTSTMGKWVSVFAMLTGVLVIAIPVSVFSDLWSEELKEIKGLESLFENESCDDNENYVSNTNLEQNCRETVSCHESQPLQNGYQEINFEEDFQSHSSRHVVMEKKDFNKIVSSISDIQDKQRCIQQILKKYLIHKEE